MKIYFIKFFVCCLTLFSLAVDFGFGGDLIPIQTIYLEARGESLEGKIAIAEVIRNRAFKRGLSFEAVCLQPKQFSCWNEPKKNAKEALSRMSAKEYHEAARAWHESEFSSLIGGADHYYNPKLCSPKWAKKLNEVKTIGQHRFMQ